MRLNAAQRELSLKIVYYGWGLSGKTTNLSHLHGSYPEEQRGRLLQLDTETERTLFFDYFPLHLGQIGGYRLKFDFFTVPGQSFYGSTRRAVLEGVDGIIFVADSSPLREEANVTSREDMRRTLADSGRPLDTIPHLHQWNKQDMRRTLADSGRPLDTIPHLHQWNKQDLRDALAPKLMDRYLNPEGAPSIPAVARNGVGVWETQSAIVRLVMESVRAATTRSVRRHA